MLRTPVVVPLILLFGLVAAGSPARLRAQEPTLDQVLARATQYSLKYLETLSGVVSEESYLQTWRRGSRMPALRALKSDVLLTRPTGGKRYLLFRDVFEVDGKQIRDRSDRLLQLFLSPSTKTSTQVLRILEESARYNIGDLVRTVNTPTLALVFLDPQFQNHFAFERSNDRVADTARDAAGEELARFTGRDDLWVVAYNEIAPRDTLMSTGMGSPLPAKGRFWIEPATGRILLSEMRLLNRLVDAVIDVRYEMAPEVGLLVPIAMRERYRDMRRESIVEGTASYSKVRRFQVTSSEALKDESK